AAHTLPCDVPVGADAVVLPHDQKLVVVTVVSDRRQPLVLARGRDREGAAVWKTIWQRLSAVDIPGCRRSLVILPDYEVTIVAGAVVQVREGLSSTSGIHGLAQSAKADVGQLLIVDIQAARIAVAKITPGNHETLERAAGVVRI